MSLILEALRKSESARQLGQAPTLTTPVRMPAPAERRIPWIAIVSALVAVALAVGATTAYWLAHVRDSAAGDADTTGGPMLEPAWPHEAPAASTGIPGPAPMPSMPQQPSADIAPSPVRPASERESLPMAADADMLEPTAEILPTVSPAALPDAPPAPDPVTVAASEVRAEPVVAVVSEATPTEPASAVVVAAEPLPPPPPPPAAESTPELPFVTDIASAERSSWPPLKQSLHLFAQQPADRAVIIDGRRLREGDFVSDGLRLVEIRRDGAVLEWREERYLLPRP